MDKLSNKDTSISRVRYLCAKVTCLDDCHVQSKHAPSLSLGSGRWGAICDLSQSSFCLSGTMAMGEAAGVSNRYALRPFGIANVAGTCLVLALRTPQNDSLPLEPTILANCRSSNHKLAIHIDALCLTTLSKVYTVSFIGVAHTVHGGPASLWQARTSLQKQRATRRCWVHATTVLVSMSCKIDAN
eukprot:199281-Amphidinium_carterae.1